MSPFKREQSPKDEDPEALPQPRFYLGQTMATPGVLEVLSQVERDPAEFFARHVIGDWGDLAEEDKRENELSVEQGFRILSAYKLNDNTKIWVITEADRSATTILLPSEY